MKMRYLIVFMVLVNAQNVLATDLANGQALFKQCLACHAVGPNANHLFGPQLNGVFERAAGSAEGFVYSPAFVSATSGGLRWSEDTLQNFLAAPMSFMPGTKMIFAGVKEEEARTEIIAYLRSIGSDGVLPSIEPEPQVESSTEDPQVPIILPGDVAVPDHGELHLGREAMAEEITAWDIDIRPDGVGLPKGSGTVETGGELYDAQCAACHGDFGEGTGRWPMLAGGYDTLTEDRPEKTIGSYWPYLSTVYDYVRRAMPFGNARSLSNNDVYAITAYLLYLNDLVDEDFELSTDNFGSIRLPNEANFIADTRPEETNYSLSGEPCMSDCMSEPATVIMRARVLDVTPDSKEEESSAGGID